MKAFYLSLFLSLSILTSTYATDYRVGPRQPLSNIAAVPWDSLQAGDRVFIYYQPTPYYEKWVINAQGTAQNKIEIIGVSDSLGRKPIIDGNGAVTPTYLDYWNENRSLIKIGGSSVPADGLPAYITVANLELRSARPAYSFTDDRSMSGTYASNAASIHIEKGEHIIIRDCIIHDSGNGIFIGASGGQTKDILIANNYIYDNGIVGSIYEHNTYTEALGITYEYNRFGPLRSGAPGNNLKDRSAGLVVRYNWIEGGNRQLDLVESGSAALYNDSSYRKTYVYGNILIEPNGAGNSQILHYGGDGSNTAQYRKGNLYFYNNTVVSTRNSNTTLARLSTQNETMTAFNNVIYTTNNGSSLAMIDNNGTLNMHHNWLRSNWVNSHNASVSGTVNDLGNNISGNSPLFNNLGMQDLYPQDSSALIDAGTAIPSIHLPANELNREYIKHGNSTGRNVVNTMDIGAFEYQLPVSISELNIEKVKLYPNPGSDLVFVEGVDQSDFQSLELFSLNGKLILRSREKVLDVSELQSGVYLIKLITRRDQVVHRFVKH
jgi:hypothetical protein